MSFRRLILPCSLLAFALAVLSPGPAAGSSHPGYRVVGSEARRVGPLTLVEETVQAGDDALARFTLHRVAGPAGARRGALLLMPPGGANFSFYTASEDGDPRESFAAFFALRGFEVWGYSPRTRGLAAGACADLDCSGLGDWGLAAFVADGLYIRDRMQAALGGRKPAVGGFSLGAMAALALLDARPDGWAGALLLDGMLWSGDPAVQAANRTVCDGLEAALASGALWDDATYPFVRLLHQAAVTDPEGPTFLPDFPAGTTHWQAYVAALGTPAPSPPGYVPGYTLAAAAQGRLLHSTAARLGLYFLNVNDYDPLALVRDYTCGLAGDRTFTGNLAAFTGPVLALGAEHGFGPWMGDNLALLGSDDVRWTVARGQGHLDLFASSRHRRHLEEPILQWLREVAH